jgi:hypothetical protein
MSEEELTKAKIWIEKHPCKHRGKGTGAIGGGISYIFSPTSIGTAITVRCYCGGEYDVTDYGSW